MRIVVPIKQVPDTKSVKIDEKTGTLIRQGAQNIVNPLDLYAVELAIRLVQQYGGETVAISMGPPMAKEALKEVVSMGIDSAILISDKLFSGSDSWATSYILSSAIQKQIGDVDLIICGERATDGDTGQVGPGIAAFLDFPILSYVNKCTDIGTSRCQVKRLTEHGVESIESELPAVLTVVKEVANPRLPTLHGKRKARHLEIPVITNSDLNLPLTNIGLNGSPTRIHKIFRPKVIRQCEKIIVRNEDDIQHSAKTIMKKLLEVGG